MIVDIQGVGDLYTGGLHTSLRLLLEVLEWLCVCGVCRSSDPHGKRSEQRELFLSS